VTEPAMRVSAFRVTIAAAPVASAAPLGRRSREEGARSRP